MHCHLCEKDAIGVCRYCYKFYCNEHGDTFCQTCQQKGWSSSEARPAPAILPKAIELAVAEVTKEVGKEASPVEAKAGEGQEKAAPVPAIAMGGST